MELLGAPLQVRAVEEHNETFAPWKRLALELRGSRRNAQVRRGQKRYRDEHFVSAWRLLGSLLRDTVQKDA